MAQSSAENFLASDKKVIAPLYGKPDVNFVSGEGSYLTDASGKKYLDFVDGIAVNTLGHRHPAVIAAIEEQLKHFIHLSNLYPNYPQIRLAEQLLELTKFDKAFFCNSGTEANEGAIKLARKYFNRTGHPERLQIVTFEMSFHGRTFGALAATGQPSLREGFGPMPGDFVHVPWNDTAALKEIVNGKTCAIMLESLAAEGGVMTLSPEMAKTVNALRKETGCFVIVDEVQAGLGRLGTFLGLSRMGLDADFVTLAKGIGGGLPLGAVLMRQKVADILKPGDHGTTFGGNPVACAAGLAVVKIVSGPTFLKAVQERSAEFLEGFKKLEAKYKFITGIRGDGLLLGLAIDKKIPVGSLAAAARAEGLLVHTAGGNVLRFLPPLTISAAEVREGLEKLDKALSTVK